MDRSDEELAKLLPLDPPHEAMADLRLAVLALAFQDFTCMCDQSQSCVVCLGSLR